MKSPEASLLSPSLAGGPDQAGNRGDGEGCRVGISPAPSWTPGPGNSLLGLTLPPSSTISHSYTLFSSHTGGLFSLPTSLDIHFFWSLFRESFLPLSPQSQSPSWCCRCPLLCPSPFSCWLEPLQAVLYSCLSLCISTSCVAWPTSLPSRSLTHWAGNRRGPPPLGAVKSPLAHS